jgi:hypothetical protein
MPRGRPMDEHPLITKLKRANHAVPRDRAALLAIVEVIEQELRQHNPADWDRQMRELEELDKALKQARAWLPYQRAMRLFNAGQRDLIAHALLLNWGLQRWCQRQRESADPGIETGKLVAILDVLAEAFNRESE